MLLFLGGMKGFILATGLFFFSVISQGQNILGVYETNRGYRVIVTPASCVFVPYDSNKDMISFKNSLNQGAHATSESGMPFSRFVDVIDERAGLEGRLFLNVGKPTKVSWLGRTDKVAQPLPMVPRAQWDYVVNLIDRRPVRRGNGEYEAVPLENEFLEGLGARNSYLHGRQIMELTAQGPSPVGSFRIYTDPSGHLFGLVDQRIFSREDQRIFRKWHEAEFDITLYAIGNSYYEFVLGKEFSVGQWLLTIDTTGVRVHKANSKIAFSFNAVYDSEDLLVSMQKHLMRSCAKKMAAAYGR